MWLLVSLIIASGLCAVGFYKLYRRRDPATGQRSPGLVVSLLLILSLGALSTLLGGAIEHKFGLVSALSELRDTPAPSPQTSDADDNDPGLVRQLARNIPTTSPPQDGSLTAWQSWQDELRNRLLIDVYRNADLFSAGGTVPVRRYRESVDGRLTQIRASIQSSDGTWVPIELLIPRSARRLAAIVVIPGHVRVGESGLDQLTGTKDSYQHSAARRLAEAGFASLAIELRGFGRLGPPRFPEHKAVAYNALLAGTFYKALIIRDIKAATDYLMARPEIDPDRMGIAGASLGGELAVAYAALDPRMKAIAFQSYGGSSGNFKAATGGLAFDPCHLIPGSGRWFQQEDVFALLAPRPTLGLRGSSEPFADPAFSAALESAWAGLGAPGNLELGSTPGGHEFAVGPAIAFFSENLTGKPETF